MRSPGRSLCYGVGLIRVLPSGHEQPKWRMQVVEEGVDHRFRQVAVSDPLDVKPTPRDLAAYLAVYLTVETGGEL